MSGLALRDFYDQQYHFGEDRDRPNADRLWRALRELAPLHGATLLDVGCGVGWSTALAVERGHARHAVGLDFSIRALSLAPRKIPGGAHHGTRHLSWVCGDGMALPFPDHSFDRAFSFGSMEHFPDVRAGFVEVERVLRPGGLAVVVVPNFYVRTGQPMEHRDSERGWRQIIEAAGLEVLRVRSDPGPAIFKNLRPLRVAMRVALRVIGALPPLRYQFIFVLRKPAWRDAD
jgi:SAM-dependent methyltransferase